MAFYLSAKFDQKDNRVPFIGDMLKKLNTNCTKEEFLYFERAIFLKVLGGNAFVKTPFDLLGEMLAFMEDNGQDVSVLWDVSLVILEAFSRDFFAFNQDPAKVAASVILLAQ